MKKEREKMGREMSKKEKEKQNINQERRFFSLSFSLLLVSHWLNTRR